MTEAKETSGPVTKLPVAGRWNEGHSPRDVLEQASKILDNVVDIAIVVRYDDGTRHTDTYGTWVSTMPFHDLLGLLDIGKMMSMQDRYEDAG